MKILAISGSPSLNGGNYNLLAAVQKAFENQVEIKLYNDFNDFMLFTPERLEQGTPENIQNFKNLVKEADAVFVACPEYNHNIPATLKNMTEWCTASGEFAEKACLAITFMSHEPRGGLAMQALSNTFRGMKANIVAELPLYHSDVIMNDNGFELTEDTKAIFEEVFKMF